MAAVPPTFDDIQCQKWHIIHVNKLFAQSASEQAWTVDTLHAPKKDPWGNLNTLHTASHTLH